MERNSNQKNGDGTSKLKASADKISTEATLAMGLLYLDLIARISFALRLSALEFCRDSTAHTAAGIHPISVICRIRQIMAVKIFPLNKKDSEGKNIEIKVIMISGFKGF